MIPLAAAITDDGNVTGFGIDAGERYPMPDLSPQLRNGLERAQRFLSVSLVLNAALAAVAIGMAARQHAERHRQVAATFRALGGSDRLRRHLGG